MPILIAYVHHIRGTTITLKTFHISKAGGKERKEYAHIALPVARSEGRKAERCLIDAAVAWIGKWVVATITDGYIIALKLASDTEAAPYRDLKQ